MSADESITSLSEAVAVYGALPMPVPVGPEPQEVDADTVAARAAQVISAMGAELRGLKKESDRLFLAWGSARMRSRRKNEALKKLKARVAELEKREAAVAEFAAKRAEYITAIRNCHPDNSHDYDRWQGHAAARRQLSELLGLPVAWPLEGGVPAPRLAHVQREPEGEHYAQAHHDYRVPRDLPETGGTQ